MIRVLLCEDEQENVDIINDLFKELQQDYDLNFELIHSETKNDSLSKLTKNFELFIIDIKLPIDATCGEIDDAAGIEIMNEIVNEYFTSRNLPVPIFQFTNYPDDFMNSFKEYTNRFSGDYFIHLPYKSKPDLFVEKNIGLLLSSLELVQMSRIKQITDKKQLNLLLASMQNHDYSGNIEFCNRDWKISDFIFPEIQYNDRVFIERTNTIKHVEKCLNFTYPKNIFNWANSKKQPGGRPSKSGFKKPQSIDLVEVYKHYISIDKKDNFSKTKEINNTSKSILNNRIACLANRDLEMNFKELNISKVEIFSLSEEIPESFFNLLVWRRVILGWLKYADTYGKESLKETVAIFENCVGKSFESTKSGTNYGTLKNTFFFLGFKLTKSGFIDPISLQSKNCFPEENDWLKSLSY